MFLAQIKNKENFKGDLEKFRLLSTVKTSDQILSFISKQKDPDFIFFLFFELSSSYFGEKEIQKEILKNEKLSYSHLRKIVLSENLSPEIHELAVKSFIDKSPILTNPDLGTITFFQIFKSGLNIKIILNFLKIAFSPFFIALLTFFPFYYFLSLEDSILFSILFSFIMSNLLWFLEKKRGWVPLIDILAMIVIILPLIIISLPLLIPGIFFYAMISASSSYSNNN